MRRPEVGFRLPVRTGSSIDILAVKRTNHVVESDVVFIVRRDGTPMPVQALTRIDMIRANVGEADVILNPAIYRKMVSRAPVRAAGRHGG